MTAFAISMPVKGNLLIEVETPEFAVKDVGADGAAASSASTVSCVFSLTLSSDLYGVDTKVLTVECRNGIVHNVALLTLSMFLVPCVSNLE